MKFLVDESLSPRLASLLTAAGHDCVHVRDLGLQGAEDLAVLALARAEGFVLISADADFGTLLTLGHEPAPSLIFFRGDFPPQVADQARRILATLEDVAGDLEKGAIIVFTGSRTRVRPL